ncbi:MAG TPA: hypothetical protein VEC14_12680, partial [Reyranellaceae bacterium]|nr:hypothetical protein [Reyranellaceae bacterium]
DKRIRRRCPELQRFSGRRGEPERKREQRRDPTGGTPRGGARADGAKPAKGKVTLTQADLDNMRAFGMDPKNKEHLREYALNKVQGGS